MPIRVRTSRRSGFSGSSDTGALPRVGEDVEALHGDGPGRAAQRAEAASDADLLVLDEDGALGTPFDEDRRQLARADRELDDVRRGNDLDAVLGADVLAAAAEDALGPLRRALLPDRVGPAAQAARA